MAELVILRGLPGSGKTTWAKEWEALDPHHRINVNRDDTRERLFGSANQDYYECPKDELHAKELLVTEANTHAISAALKAGFSVVVSDTNLPLKRCKELARLAVAAGVPWREMSFADVSLDVCLERNALRQDKEPVPAEVVRDMHKRYIAGGLIPIPADIGEVADYSEIVPVTTDDTLPDAFIFDIDGTLAHMTGRSPYDYSRVSEDVADRDVRLVANTLFEAPFDIFVVSGRKSECIEKTQQWLLDNAIGHDVLLMRAEGDDRKDWKVKYDLFNEYIRGRYNVRGVFDDRRTVLRMWEALGLTTFHVGGVDGGDF